MLKSLFFIFLLALSGIQRGLSETLTIYTYSAFVNEWGPGPAIKRAFEAHCNCTIKFVALESSHAILNRLKLEGKNSRADIILGVDNTLCAAAKKSGLFVQHPVDTRRLNIPGGWHDPYLLPCDYGYGGFIYHRQQVFNPPQSLEELVASTHPWRIIYSDPRTSGHGFYLLLWMKKVYGAQAKHAWRQLAKKTVTVTKGWSEAYVLFLRGEADLMFSYTTSPAYHMTVLHDHAYTAALFKEGHPLQVRVAAKLADSPHPRLADQFMQFIMTPIFQQTILQSNWMYPVLDIPVPEAFAKLPKPKIPLTFTAEYIADHRQHWIQEWQDAVSHP